MTGEPIWLARETLIVLHEAQLVEHGGARGIRDADLLDSALARPRNAFLYGAPSVFEMAAAYAHGIVKNHPFVDGNKRMGFLAAAVFLDLNGWALETSDADIVQSVLGLASSTLSEADFAAWLEANAVRVSD